MKWGTKKKSFSSSLPPPPSRTHMLSLSWISRLKKISSSSISSLTSNLKKNQERDQALNLDETKAISEKMYSDWQKLKEPKLKSDKQKESDYLERRRQNSKMKAVKIEGKTNAIEDMKKVKMKKVTKEREVEYERGFNSFAIVKSSVDPQQDFRDSMVEMITEKGIRGAGELEDLLACYLTLNSDEYHHLIIQVFREVWLELSKFVYQELQFENCCNVTENNCFSF
ncbi:hypothetical protein LguiB_004761 [Lonicera macranthoides]